jgi:hypothetical protein
MFTRIASNFGFMIRNGIEDGPIYDCIIVTLLKCVGGTIVL